MFKKDESLLPLKVLFLYSSCSCSSMFSVSVEWKGHPDEMESDVFRSRLQLFSLAGAASRADLRGSVVYLHSAHCAKNDPAVILLRGKRKAAVRYVGSPAFIWIEVMHHRP